MRRSNAVLEVVCLFILVLMTGCIQISPDSSSHTPATTSAIMETAMTSAIIGTPEHLVRGMADPAFTVDISIPEKMAPGFTLLPDNHDLNHPCIIEVNQLGEIVWNYTVPDELKNNVNPGFSVVPLKNGNILAVFPRNGVYEINRSIQKVVWTFMDPLASHDAERLDNGNTLVVDGGYGADTPANPAVREISSSGDVIWTWYAKDHFDTAPYTSISDEGWTHTNAASRLANGDTLISLRNFNFIVEVDQKGDIVRKIGEGLLTQQHDPEALPNGDILLTNLGNPQKALELDANSSVVWSYPILNHSSFPVRDADRLSNGNTLITAADRIIEVTPDHQVVWEFKMARGGFSDKMSASNEGFYKAERVAG